MHGMRRLRLQAGYTIVEVMFFLIISAGLFGAAVVGISNQNQRTLFTNEVDRLQNRLQDALNDVSTGYYPSNLRLACEATDSGPVFPANASIIEQGTNQDCIFVGKAIQFRTQGGQTNYISYTLVGNRLVRGLDNDKQVSSIAEAMPKALGVFGRGGVLEDERLNAGLVINRVIAIKDPSAQISGIAVISDFGKTASLGKTVTGTASRVSFGVVKETTMTMGNDAFVTKLEEPDMIDLFSTDPDSLASEGLILCLEEAGGGRRASITIGGNNQQLSLERTIDTWPTECEP